MDEHCVTILWERDYSFLVIWGICISVGKKHKLNSEDKIIETDLML